MQEGFSGGSGVKNLLANAGDVGSAPQSGRSPGEGNAVFLPGKSYGQRRLTGYCPCCHQESGNDWATKPPPLLIQYGWYFYTKGKFGYRHAQGSDALSKLEPLDKGPQEVRREPGADPSLDLWAPQSFIFSQNHKTTLGWFEPPSR